MLSGVVFHNIPSHTAVQVLLQLIGAIIIYKVVSFVFNNFVHDSPSPVGAKGIPIASGFSLGRIVTLGILSVGMYNPELAGATSAATGVVPIVETAAATTAAAAAAATTPTYVD